MAILLVLICTMKLRIIPDSQHINSIKLVSDDDHRVICSMRYEDLPLAQRIVRRENGWWYSLFGATSDKRQKDYDRWVREH